MILETSYIPLSSKKYISRNIF